MKTLITAPDPAEISSKDTEAAAFKAAVCLPRLTKIKGELNKITCMGGEIKDSRDQDPQEAEEDSMTAREPLQ